MKLRPCWCSKPVLGELELFFYHNVRKTFLWPGEWECSTSNRFREIELFSGAIAKRTSLLSIDYPRLTKDKPKQGTFLKLNEEFGKSTAAKIRK